MKRFDDSSPTKTQLDLIMEYFRNNPRRDIKHPEIVDWVVAEYKKRTGKIFRDPDSGIRILAHNGLLTTVSKGIYRYDPDFVPKRAFKDLTPAQKEATMHARANAKRGVNLKLLLIAIVLFVTGAFLAYVVTSWFGAHALSTSDVGFDVIVGIYFGIFLFFLVGFILMLVSGFADFVDAKIPDHTPAP
jgi:hypothetical protein